MVFLMSHSVTELFHASGNAAHGQPPRSCRRSDPRPQQQGRRRRHASHPEGRHVIAGRSHPSYPGKCSALND